MSLINEYINKKFGGFQLEGELLRLISEYNKIRSTYLFVYAAAIGKPIPAVPLEQADFYVIRDLLSEKKGAGKVDFYIETPGGSGETAEEIVRFLRGNFETVSFVVSGEAKSAGTLIVLSGDEILMTETGSLGPIDAQMRIGRSIVSAYDYVEWVEEKRKEAEERGSLNPFDATMIAQISPGELGSVLHALNFARDRVVEWLTNYKFKRWDVTETRKLPVTREIKIKQAEEIANKLTDHSKWRLHGRSIKITDLEDIGLKITKVDENSELADIVYRIQVVCRLLFETTSVFKIFATQDNKIFRQAVSAGAPINLMAEKQVPDVVEIKQKCPKCGIVHGIYGKLAQNPQIDADFKKRGLKPFPKDAKLTCGCGFQMDLAGIRNNIEIQTGRKIVSE